MSAVARAEALGREHGTQAAEAWLGLGGWNPRLLRLLGRAEHEKDRGRYNWPQPDLSMVRSDFAHGRVPGSTAICDNCDAYEAAFTAAVESTIRQASEA